MTVTARRAVAAVAVVCLVAACGSPPFVPPPPSPARVFAMNEVDERPEIVLAPPLKYPERGSDGMVVVRVVIDSAGNPEPSTVMVTRGSDSVLVGAARTMVLKTLFRPGRVRGRVVQTLVDIPVEFSAQSEPPVTLYLTGDVYRMEDVQQQPHLVSGPILTYPAPLLLSRVTGRVVVEAVIDTTGRVEEETVRIVESSDPGFNESAKVYVEAARFTPARIAGRAVPVRLQMPVEFKLPTR